MIPPKIDTKDLQRRYDALGPLRELPGERTFFGRCASFESFLDYGPSLAQFARAGNVTAEDWQSAPEPHRSQWPGLVSLASEAWPGLPALD
jgi:hypothetical protein